MMEIAVICSLSTLLLFLLVTLFSLNRSFHLERKDWSLERKDLLNRIQSRDWQTYVQVSQTQTPLSFEDGEPFPEGLSDESEIDKLIRENRLDEIEPEVDYTDEFRMMGLIE
jgi:hypothetical protein